MGVKDFKQQFFLSFSLPTSYFPPCAFLTNRNCFAISYQARSVLFTLSYHAYCSPYHMSGARQDIFTGCNDISNDATDDDTDNNTDDFTA